VMPANECRLVRHRWRYQDRQRLLNPAPRAQSQGVAPDRQVFVWYEHFAIATMPECNASAFVANLPIKVVELFRWQSNVEGNTLTKRDNASSLLTVAFGSETRRYRGNCSGISGPKFPARVNVVILDYPGNRRPDHPMSVCLCALRESRRLERRHVDRRFRPRVGERV
jgi:hypothetical protein